MCLPVRATAAALLAAILTSACTTALPDLTGRRIPQVAFDAYRAAAAAAPSVAEGCAVEWQVVAGLGRVESNHGRTGGRRTLEPGGDITPPIRGLPLDGEEGRQRIPDTDGGELDGDTTWDRAMGPLQFIPTSWLDLGRDGSGDGVADPDNVYDAALTAVAHLCQRDPGDYSDRAALRRALVGYNASGAYADEVLEWVTRYRDTPLDELVIPTPGGSPAAS